MTTKSTLVLDAIAAEWVKLYDSAVFAGIVGDTAHAQRGGYHISIEDQPDKNNYSVIRPDDKAPPGAWPRDRAAAIDMKLELPDMKICHARLKAVWHERSSDPRAGFINAWNGWDGNGSPGRYDMVTGTVSTADDGHKWHVHLELRRRYVNSLAAQPAILSILAGQSLAAYLGTGEQDDMSALDAKQGIADAFREAATTTDSTTANDTTWGRQFRESFNSVIDFSNAVGPLSNAIGTLTTLVMHQSGVTAEQIAAALAPLIHLPEGSLTADQVREAVKQALREGTAVAP